MSDKDLQQVVKHLEDDERLYKDYDISNEQLIARFKKAYGSLPEELSTGSLLQAIQTCITNSRSALESCAEDQAIYLMEHLFNVIQVAINWLFWSSNFHFLCRSFFV